MQQISYAKENLGASVSAAVKGLHETSILTQSSLSLLQATPTRQLGGQFRTAEFELFNNVRYLCESILVLMRSPFRMCNNNEGVAFEKEDLIGAIDLRKVGQTPLDVHHIGISM